MKKKSSTPEFNYADFSGSVGASDMSVPLEYRTTAARLERGALVKFAVKRDGFGQWRYTIDGAIVSRDNFIQNFMLARGRRPTAAELAPIEKA